MSPYVEIHIGDARETLKRLPDGYVNCVVTSPPYFGLRNYQHADQMGLERTPEEYVANLVSLFREVRRVLRPDGVVWLNLGDSYSNAGTRQGDRDGLSPDINEHRKVNGGYRPRVDGLKNKDLIGIPWLVAFALRADGYYLRQDIIWAKGTSGERREGSVMPESVTDRCTKSHEYIFLLTKSPKYYYDAAAIAEPVSESFANDTRWTSGPTTTNYKEGYETCGARNPKAPHAMFNGSKITTANRRSVWRVGTKNYRGVHFATFPPELIRPCVRAGCPVGGLVLDPFGGSGTTAQVCLEEGRRAVILELNPDYAPLINERVNQTLERLDKQAAKAMPKPPAVPKAKEPDNQTEFQFVAQQ